MISQGPWAWVSILLSAVEVSVVGTGPWAMLLACIMPDGCLRSLAADWFSEFGSPALVLVAQSCLTLCDPLDCSLPGSSVRGRILQAGILEWVAIPFSRGASRPRDRTCVSCIGRQVLSHSLHLGSPQLIMVLPEFRAPVSVLQPSPPVSAVT